MGWGQTAVGAAAVTSGCDQGSQAGPQGAGEEGAQASPGRALPWPLSAAPPFAVSRLCPVCPRHQPQL